MTVKLDLSFHKVEGEKRRAGNGLVVAGGCV